MYCVHFLYSDQWSSIKYSLFFSCLRILNNRIFWSWKLSVFTEHSKATFSHENMNNAISIWAFHIQADYIIIIIIDDGTDVLI